MPALRDRVSLGGRDETRRRQREAVLPSRSAEVWPLSVPALSQLSHGACSPDCTVSHWVACLCCLTALCTHFSQPLQTAPPPGSGAWRRASECQQHRARSFKRADSWGSGMMEDFRGRTRRMMFTTSDGAQHSALDACDFYISDLERACEPLQMASVFCSTTKYGNGADFCQSVSKTEDLQFNLTQCAKDKHMEMKWKRSVRRQAPGDHNWRETYLKATHGKAFCLTRCVSPAE